MRFRRRRRHRKYRLPELGELVVLVSSAYDYNGKGVPVVEKSKYDSYDGRSRAGFVVRGNDIIKEFLPSPTPGVYLGHVGVRADVGLCGGYHILVDEKSYVVPPGYVEFVLNNKRKYMQLCQAMFDERVKELPHDIT